LIILGLLIEVYAIMKKPKSAWYYYTRI
jgi:hypothetical protein